MSKTNISTSIRQRLFSLSVASNRQFDEILGYYSMERFIHRLSQSHYRDKFILKGALMFSVWDLSYTRATRDIDLLGYTKNTQENINKIIKEICSIENDEDGIKFIVDSVTSEIINRDSEYSGVRTTFFAEIARAKSRIQIDIGFNDIVHPKPVSIKYPTLIGMTTPEIYSYTPETLIAEKVHAMFYHAVKNSRIKDYFDIWFLSHQFEFDGQELITAIHKTFAKRDTNLPKVGDYILSGEYENDITKQKQWSAFIKKNKLSVAQNDFKTVFRHIKSFILPLFKIDMKNNNSFRIKWLPSGPWKTFESK